MTAITGPSLSAIDAKDSIEVDFWRELAEIEAESMGWQALDDGVYLHVGSELAVVQITGCATPAMAGCNVLWVV